MASTPITEHPDIQRVREILRTDGAYRSLSEELTELIATSREPLVSLLARATLVAITRRMGRHEAAVVELAETLEHVASTDLSDVPSSYARELVIALASGTHSSLDVPEVDFEAVDGVLARLEQLCHAVGIRPFLVWKLRIRRHVMAEQHDEAERWTRRLLPHVNFTNRFFHGLDCPSCTLGYIAALRGPETDPDAVAEHLAPVYAGDTGYPGEHPAVLAYLEKKKTVNPCESGLQACSTSHGRALLHAGRFDEARERIALARSLGPGGNYLWPEIASLELALAEGGAEQIGSCAAHLSPLAAKHEDIEERFWAEVRLVQAGRALQQAVSDRAATECAQRLDRRLGRPTFSERLASELSEGPRFALRDEARRAKLTEAK
jgi:hypothetical protein